MPTERGAESSPRIRDVDVLRSLANPHRSRLLEILHADGPATVGLLAKRLGVAVGSASHHLRSLAKSGLIESAFPPGGDQRETWWQVSTERIEWSRGDLQDDPVADTAARAAESMVLSRQAQHARDWIEDTGADKDWLDVAFAVQRWLRLSPGELAALNAELLELLQRYESRPAVPGDVQESVLFFARAFPSNA